MPEPTLDADALALLDTMVIGGKRKNRKGHTATGIRVKMEKAGYIPVTNPSDFEAVKKANRAIRALARERGGRCVNLASAGYASAYDYGCSIGFNPTDKTALRTCRECGADYALTRRREDDGLCSACHGRQRSKAYYHANAERIKAKKRRKYDEKKKRGNNRKPWHVTNSSGEHFDSIKEASAAYFVAEEAIRQACNGFAKRCCGVSWAYGDEVPPLKEYAKGYGGRKTKAVIRDDGTVYVSVAEAVRALGRKTTASISRCCNGMANTAYGHRWAFMDSDLGREFAAKAKEQDANQNQDV